MHRPDDNPPPPAPGVPGVDPAAAAPAPAGQSDQSPPPPGDDTAARARLLTRLHALRAAVATDQPDHAALLSDDLLAAITAKAPRGAKSLDAVPGMTEAVVWALGARLMDELTAWREKEEARAKKKKRPGTGPVSEGSDQLSLSPSVGPDQRNTPSAGSEGSTPGAGGAP